MYQGNGCDSGEYCIVSVRSLWAVSLYHSPARKCLLNCVGLIFYFYFCFIARVKVIQSHPDGGSVTATTSSGRLFTLATTALLRSWESSGEPGSSKINSTSSTFARVLLQLVSTQATVCLLASWGVELQLFVECLTNMNTIVCPLNLHKKIATLLHYSYHSFCPYFLGRRFRMEVMAVCSRLPSPARLFATHWLWPTHTPSPRGPVRCRQCPNLSRAVK